MLVQDGQPEVCIDRFIEQVAAVAIQSLGHQVQLGHLLGGNTKVDRVWFTHNCANPYW